MLKHTNPTEPSLPQAPANAANAPQALFKAPQEKKKGLLEDMEKYSKLAIEDPVRPFNIADLTSVVEGVNYGILEKLNGTWVSYMSKADEGKFKGTGIHTTIMPSPGTNSGGIPGKFSFDCQEYIERLVFTKVPGGVRNRGGNNEQFCGAFKYEQSIKAVTKEDDKTELQYTPIHEENGMYLWLSDVFNHAATAQSIKEDRGIHAVSTKNENKDLYPSGYQDETLFRISPDGNEKVYVTLEELNGRPYYDIIAAKELKPGAGQTGPYFIPDYSLSRSGVIPHGSTITLLGDLKSDDKGKFLLKGAPKFPEGIATWNFPHLSISKTMGGAGKDPINLDEKPPAWVHETLNDVNDPGENKIYTQRILKNPLYPYSVRPDLRLRDANKGETINNHVLIQMSSKHPTGAQGGILNVPFVNRFVPTVEMNTNMWIEAVEEDGREILQLQYEQVIFFEFHFGDDGGTTSWPHIQVNTLRKIEDVSPAQRKFIEDQFREDHTIAPTAPPSGCPVHKG